MLLFVSITLANFTQSLKQNQKDPLCGAPEFLSLPVKRFFIRSVGFYILANYVQPFVHYTFTFLRDSYA